MEIFCDSQSAIALSKNAVYHEKTKHVATKYHFIRDLITAGEVQVLKIATAYNPADIFTKVLPVFKFERHLSCFESPSTKYSSRWKRLQLVKAAMIR